MEENDIEYERFTIQLAKHLLAWIDRERKKPGLTRSAFMGVLVSDAMQRQREVEAKD